MMKKDKTDFTVYIHISPITTRDFAALFKQHRELRSAGIGDYLVFAYNLIFNPIVQTVDEINLTDAQLEKVNLLLLAGENMINKKLSRETLRVLSSTTNNIKQSETSYIPYLDLIIQGAENAYLNDMINKAKGTQIHSITEQIGEDRTRRIKRVNKNFGTKTYKMKLALVFYLTELLVESIAKKDMNNYGYLIHHIHQICFNFEEEMPQHVGGNNTNSTEKSLKELYSRYYEEYTQYAEDFEPSFDWGDYVGSLYLKREFRKCARDGVLELPQSVIEGYETDCLRRKNR